MLCHTRIISVDQWTVDEAIFFVDGRCHGKRIFTYGVDALSQQWLHLTEFC